MSYETRTMPSGIVIENRPNQYSKYCWYSKSTGILHNEGEPAVEYKNENKIWFQHNKYHRLDGPAVEYYGGGKYYYIDDVYYKEEDYWKHTAVLAFKYLKEHPELEGFI